MRPRTRTLTLNLAVVATVAALSVPLTSSAQAAQPSGHATGGTALRVRESHQVTLVTGDRASLEVYTDGTSRATLTAPGRSTSGYHEFSQNGDSYLVPASAETLVADGVLDRELFNVSGLVRAHFDDAGTGSLPLIVTYPATGGGTARTLASTAAPRGSSRHAVLAAVHGLAVTENKKAASTFWAGVTGSASRATALRPRLAGGIGHIWLDARVHADLDQSVPQIGGPAAWARGLDGTGVTVAVLDTGIDPDHPDFAGRITATADFTGSGDTVDRAGHGTHVASILAGSGAASGGRYRGVAPGAHLMVGKVLGDDGSGLLSDALAGMQWAASHGASVVNLSLGGPVTRGDDPASVALNHLSEQYGTLFVVAAGNHSPFQPDSPAVTTPAAADDALAVGSVNKQDRLANDSRRGRFGGSGIKPELVAPGVAITAARAAGTGNGTDPHYTTMSGTSMAAPHAAGSAVLLKEEHPDWNFAALRAALTSTSTPLDHTAVAQVGAGRIDVDRATRQQVFVDQGTLDLGYLARPYDPATLRQERTLHYRNGSMSPVTLHLSTSLSDTDGGSPDGALTVSPSTLTLAPGGRAEATVRLDATDVTPSTYSGRVVADDGADLRLGTAVGFYKQDDTVDVSIRALDRHGRPASATMRLAQYKKEDFDGRYFPDLIHVTPDSPEQIVRVPEGDYNLWAVILTPDASGRFVEERSVVSLPRVRAHAPNPAIVLDARTARPVSLSTPRPSTIRSFAMSWFRGSAGTPFHAIDTMGVMVGDGSPERVSVAGTDRVDDAPFSVTTALDASPPTLVTRSAGHTLDAVWEGGPPIDGRERMPVADAGAASPAELDGRSFAGRVTLVHETSGVDLQDQVDAVVAHGAPVVMVYSAEPGVFWPAVGGSRTVLALPKDQGDALHDQVARGRPVTLDFDGQPNAPYAYDLAFVHNGQVPDRLDYRVRSRDLAEVTDRIHGTGTGERGYLLHDFVYTPCGCHTSFVADWVPSVGFTRTEYVTARPDLQVIPIWQYRPDLLGQDLVPRDAVVYEPGQRLTSDWLKAPFSPGPASNVIDPFNRIGATSRTSDDFLEWSIADWTDSAGHWAPVMDSTRPSSRLFRDGTLIASSDFLPRGRVKVAPEAGAYRLEVDVDHDGSTVGLSTHTSSAWTFHSAPVTTTKNLPLVDVDYTGVVDRNGRDLLDLLNTAPGDADATLLLSTGHQAGSSAAAVDAMTVSVSFDDGRTWTAAQVSRGPDGQFRARYRHPGVGSAGGYVSIRVSASDPDGNTLDQTLIRAYRLGGR